jgi:hypothetical protein
MAQEAKIVLTTEGAQSMQDALNALRVAAQQDARLMDALDVLRAVHNDVMASRRQETESEGSWPQMPA